MCDNQETIIRKLETDQVWALLFGIFLASMNSTLPSPARETETCVSACLQPLRFCARVVTVGTYWGHLGPVSSLPAADSTSAHLGGADALYGAGGQDLEIMWKHYPVHYNKPEVGVKTGTVDVGSPTKTCSLFI